MHNQIKSRAPVTLKICYWSNGKMPKSAYNRMNELKSKDHDDAKVIRDEWIID